MNMLSRYEILHWMHIPTQAGRGQSQKHNSLGAVAAINNTYEGSLESRLKYKPAESAVAALCWITCKDKSILGIIG